MSRRRAVVAIILLPVFGAVADGAPIIGLLLLLGALGLLWQSKFWTVWDKVLATLVLPTGILLTVVWMVIAFNNSSEECVSHGDLTHCVTHDPGFGWNFAVASVVAGALVVFVYYRLITALRAER